ncbi:hypothetical protein KKC17_00290 [Patescibacteria group bacterium]|nr:hypothetical protein [Patescibacteria group bacterium]
MSGLCGGVLEGRMLVLVVLFMSKEKFDTKTEESFCNFFKNVGENIVKIKGNNFPDFLVDDRFVFEIKEINKSGTEEYSNGVKIQKINIINVVNKYIIDFDKKIKSYEKIKKCSYYGLVFYNLRYQTDNHIKESFKNSKIKNYKIINSLIYAGYNKPTNTTLALSVFNNKDFLLDDIFNDLNYEVL